MPQAKPHQIKKHALTDACFQEASAALRKERRPGRRGREAATRTAAPGTAHPDGPSGRRERRRYSGGCRTPGLLRGWRKPLNPTAWWAEHSQCKTVNTRRQAKYAPALRANSLKKNPLGKATPNKKTRPHRRVFSGGIRRAEERAKARTARQGSRDEDGCARDGASGRSVRPQ